MVLKSLWNDLKYTCKKKIFISTGDLKCFLIKSVIKIRINDTSFNDRMKTYLEGSLSHSLIQTISIFSIQIFFFYNNIVIIFKDFNCRNKVLKFHPKKFQTFSLKSTYVTLM